MKRFCKLDDVKVEISLMWINLVNLKVIIRGFVCLQGTRNVQLNYLKGQYCFSTRIGWRTSTKKKEKGWSRGNLQQSLSSWIYESWFNSKHGIRHDQHRSLTNNSQVDLVCQPAFAPRCLFQGHNMKSWFQIVSYFPISSKEKTNKYTYIYIYFLLMFRINVSDI